MKVSGVLNFAIWRLNIAYHPSLPKSWFCPLTQNRSGVGDAPQKAAQWGATFFFVIANSFIGSIDRSHCPWYF